MRAYIYDIAGLALTAASLFFFYRAIISITENDYVGAVITMLIGFMVIRVGVDLSRLGLLAAEGVRPRRSRE